MNDETFQGSPSALSSYWRVLRRQWWVPTLVTLVAIAAAIVYTQRATPEYSSSMKIVVGQGSTLFGADASGAFQPFTQTMIDLLKSDVVARQTVAARRLTTDADDLLSRITVTTNPDTSVLQVSLRGEDRAENTRTLQALGTIFTKEVDRKLGVAALSRGATGTSGAATPTRPRRPATTTPRTQAERLQQAAQDAQDARDEETRRLQQAQLDQEARDNAVTATIFDPAHADKGQVSPHVKRTLALAIVLGLAAGILLAFLRDALSRGIRGEAEAAELFETSVLAALPTGVLGVKPTEVGLLPRQTSDRIRESVGLLGASLRYGSGRPDGGVVVVTSARPEDGKTSVVAHLAATLSDTGAWVAAVEADLHKPALHRMFDVDGTKTGLTDVLQGQVTAEDALVVVPRPQPDAGDAEPSARFSRLELLVAGPRHAQPAELLSLSNLGTLLSALRELVEWVVVDTPPLLLSGDPFPLLQLADHVVVVCREGQTTRDEAHAVVKRLKALGVERYSVVITESAEAGQRTYGYSTVPA